MTYLRIDLLGGFSVRFRDGSACPLPTRKAEALLAFLAMPAGRLHARDKLANLFWGGAPEAQARQSLRQALAALRRAARGEQPALLLTQGDTVGLNPAAVEVDAAALEAAAAGSDPGPQDAAAGRYAGDFLDGLKVDEPAFEDWRVTERERLREIVLSLLSRRLRAETAGEAAIPLVQRLLAIDPLREEGHRRLMQLYLDQGRRAAALQQYQLCIGILERELGAEPEEETRALYRRILRAGAGGTPAAAPVPAAGAGPLIGRGGELDRLAAALARMLSTGGQVVLLRGEAGIGKSRLLAEFSALAAGEGLALSLGRCHETEQILPLQPWIDALRGGAGRLDPSLGEGLGPAATMHLSRAFPELLPTGVAAGTSGEQYALLFDALARLVGLLAAGKPLILVLEDLHWADELSVRFMAFLGRRLDRLPVLVVASMRPEELVDTPVLAQALRELRDEPRVEEVALAPLSREDTLALVDALQPGGARRRAEAVWSISEGNPFVIVETVRALRAQGAAGGEPGIARGVQDFVAERLDRLGEPARAAVAVAAVIGREFTFPLILRAAGLDEQATADVIEELVRRRVFETLGEEFDFCHEWIRRVAYHRLLPQRRAALHAAVGRALEDLHAGRTGEVADQLGHHYSRAGDATRAIPHLVAFAGLAARRYALDDAVRAFGQAMTAVRGLPEAERDARLLDLTLRRAFVLSMQGRQREIADLLAAEAAAVERVSDPLLVSEYHFRVGLTAFYLGERGRGEAAAIRALAEGERAGHAEAIGKALHVLSLACFEAGRPREGVAHARRAIPLLDLPHAQQWFGLAHHDLALNCLMLGDLPAALDAAEREATVGRASEWPRVIALAGYVTTWALALQGETGAAIRLAEATLAQSRDPMVGALVSGALAFARLEQGEAAAAIPLLTEAVARLRVSPVRTSEIRHSALLAEAELANGDLAAARAGAAATLAMAEGDGNVFNIGLAERAEARIALAEGRNAEAARLLERALATFGRCEAAFEAARTRVLLASLLAETGRRAEARAHLAAALPAFRAAGAQRRLRDLASLCADLQVDLPPRPG